MWREGRSEEDASGYNSQAFALVNGNWVATEHNKGARYIQVGL